MKNYIFSFLFLASLSTFAQIPSNYYDSANGLSGFALKAELNNIISNGHVAQSYDDLYDGAGVTGSNGYIDTHTDNLSDTGYENDGTVLDFYSENPNGTDPYNYTHGVAQCGNQSAEGDCYNREHLVPQSSFNSQFPMQSDIHHVIPTDGRVNNFRGSLVFGEVATPNWTSLNGSQRGSSAITGYTGTVFEPIDEFKGDIARALLYFAVRYEDNIASYTSFEMFDGTEADQEFFDWAIDMLLDWHYNVDPVDQAEIDRNQAAYNFQGNANPFVDHPEYANLIWNPNPDTEAPTVPTNLMVSNETSSTIDVSWTASTDNVGVTAYDVYVDGAFDQTVSITSATVTGLSPETTYTFTVLAKDAVGNSSAQSSAVNGTTTATGGNGCGGGNSITETFTSIPANSSTYATQNWTGDDGGTWTATDARTDQTLNGRAITIRNGTLTSPSLSGGIGDLTVTTVRVFSGGTGTFTVRVNGNAVGTIPYSDTNQTTTLTDINIEGDIVVSFTDKTTGSDRVIIDDLSWTCFEPLSIEDNTLSGLNVYPNPSRGNIFIDTPNISKDLEVKVFDITGKLILITEIDKTRKNTLLPNLPKGMLLLELTTSKKSIIKKVIIQ